MTRHLSAAHSLSGTLSGSGDDPLTHSERLSREKDANHALPHLGSLRHAITATAAATQVVAAPHAPDGAALPLPQPIHSPPHSCINRVHVDGGQATLTGSVDHNAPFRRHTAPLPQHASGEASLVSAKYASARVPTTSSASLLEALSATEAGGEAAENAPQGTSPANSATTDRVSEVFTATGEGKMTPPPSDRPPFARQPQQPHPPSHSAVSQVVLTSSSSPTRSAPPLGFVSTTASPLSSHFRPWTHREPQWWSDLWLPQVGYEVYLSLEGCEQQFFFLENLGPEVYRLIYEVLIPYRLMGFIARDAAEVPRVPFPARKRSRRPVVHAGPSVPVPAEAREDGSTHEDGSIASPFANVVTGEFKPSSSKDTVTVVFVVPDALLKAVFGGGHQPFAATASPVAVGQGEEETTQPSVTRITLTLPRTCCIVVIECHLKEAVANLAQAQPLALPSARTWPRRDVMEDSNERPAGRTASVAQSHSLWVRLQRAVSQNQFESAIELLGPMKPLKEARHLFPGRRAASRVSLVASTTSAVGTPPPSPPSPPPPPHPHANRRSQTEAERQRDVANPLAGVMTGWTQLYYLASMYVLLCTLYFAAADDPRSAKAARRGFQKIIDKARDWRHVISRALAREDFTSLCPCARQFFAQAACHLRVQLELCTVEAHLALGNWSAAQVVVEGICALPTANDVPPRGASSVAVADASVGPGGPTRSGLPLYFYRVTRRVHVQRMLSHTLRDPVFRGLPKTPSFLRQQRLSPRSHRPSAGAKDDPQDAASAFTLVGGAVVAPTPGVSRLLHVVDPSTYPAVTAASPLGFGQSPLASAAAAAAVATVAQRLVPPSSPPPQTSRVSPESLFYSTESSPLNIPSSGASATGKSCTHTPHPLNVNVDVSRVASHSPFPVALSIRASPGQEHLLSAARAAAAASSPSPMGTAMSLASCDGASPQSSAEPRLLEAHRPSLLSLIVSEHTQATLPGHRADAVDEGEAAVTPLFPSFSTSTIKTAVPTAATSGSRAPGDTTTSTADGSCSAAAHTAHSRTSDKCVLPGHACQARHRRSSKKSSASSVAALLPPPPPPSSTFLDRVVGFVHASSSAGKSLVEPRTVKGLTPVVTSAGLRSRRGSELDLDTPSTRSLGNRSQLLGGAVDLSQWPAGSRPAQIAQWVTLYARQRAWLQPGLFAPRAAGPTTVPMALFQRQIRLSAPRSFRTGDEVVSESATMWMPLLAPELCARRRRQRPSLHSSSSASQSAAYTPATADPVCCSTCGELTDSPAHGRGAGAGPGGFHTCACCGASYGSLSCLLSAVARFQFVLCSACSATATMACHAPAGEDGASGSRADTTSAAPSEKATTVDPRLDAVRSAFQTFQLHLEKLSVSQNADSLLDWIALRLLGRALAMLLTFVLCPAEATESSVKDKLAFLEALSRRAGLVGRTSPVTASGVTGESTTVPKRDPQALPSCDELLLAEDLLQHVGVPFIADVTLGAPNTVWESLRRLPHHSTPTSTLASVSTPPPTAEDAVYSLCASLGAAMRLPGAGGADRLGHIQVGPLLSFLSNLRFMDQLFDLCRTAFALVPTAGHVDVTPCQAEASSSGARESASVVVVVLSPLLSVISDMPRLPSTAPLASSGMAMTVLEQVKQFYGPPVSTTTTAITSPVMGPLPAVKGPTAATAAVMTPAREASTLVPVKPGWLNNTRFYLEYAAWRLTMETESEAEAPLGASSFLSIASSFMSASASGGSRHPTSTPHHWSADEDDRRSGARGQEEALTDLFHNVSAVLEVSIPCPVSSTVSMAQVPAGRVVLTATRFISPGTVLSLHGCPNLD